MKPAGSDFVSALIKIKSKSMVWKKSATTSKVSKTTSGTARLGETTPEACLLCQLYKEVTSVQNYDSEPLEKLVKCSGTILHDLNLKIVAFARILKFQMTSDHAFSPLPLYSLINRAPVDAIVCPKWPQKHHWRMENGPPDWLFHLR